MNTANLQLQGVLTVLAALLKLIEEKRVLSRAEIETALDRAEAEALAGAEQHEKLSDAHIEAVRFPARFVRMALSGEIGASSFSDIATRVGQSKDGAPKGPGRV